MVTYHYQPKQEYECDKIQRALDILKGVIAREDKRHQMDQHFRLHHNDSLFLIVNY